ncbi:MAG: PepSY-associated TM helix domain-containing protein [Pirellulales bacterium]
MTDTKAGGKHKPGSTSLHRLAAKWFRWMHIYFSMLSLAAILFFSVTGFTLNHPDWFFSESSARQQGQLNADWLNLKVLNPEGWDENDFGHQIDKLKVAEFLRAEHRLSGRVSDFLAFSDDCEVTFQGPGYAATARISRADGKYELNVTQNDLVSVMNDFHKGRNTGPIWSWVIDISAILATIVSLSGFALVFYLRLNRRRRVVVSILGLILVVILIQLLR